MSESINLQEVLKKRVIQVSAPGRIDCGGTWDLKALALLKEKFHPITVNIAINLRTTVELLPYECDKVCVESIGFRKEHFSVDKLSFVTPLGIILAVISYFNVAGLKIVIRSEIPTQSGLGGSSVVTVAVIRAISKALELIGQPVNISKNNIAILAHNIEDGLRFSFTGLQDQLAAVYGGVNKWSWFYGSYKQPYKRQILLEKDSYEDLQKRILLAFTGDSRNSKDISLKYVESFLKGDNFSKWIKIKQATEDFAQCIYEKNWTGAGKALNKEFSLREEIVPELMTTLSYKLKNAAIKCNCGVATAGGNRAGCIWAIGEEDCIFDLKKSWQKLVGYNHKGYLIPVSIAKKGMITIS